MGRRLVTSVGLAVAIAVGLSVGDVVVHAERQTLEELRKIQAFVEVLVKRSSDAIAASLRPFAHGVLSDDAARAFIRWDATTSRWKREREAGAAPHLAEGVMWDCLSRMGGVVTPPMVSAESGGGFAEEKERARPIFAVKAFDLALKLDSTLIEAQFRRARILAATDADAAKDLERLAGRGTDTTIEYLSAISRAETAVRQKETAIAVQWYEGAQMLYPRSAAAAIGLSLLVPTRDVAVDELDATDPYYRYPCRVLTAAVDRELTRRMQSPQGP